MMNWLWGILIAAGMAGYALMGDPAGAVDAMMSGAGEAVSLCLSLCGTFMLWMGLMNVAREAGLIDKLGRVMEPVLRRLMPDSPGAIAPVTLNLSANFFGLGSAATPFGLEAMKEMQKHNPNKAVATDDMCMFIALNSSAIELLPTGVLAMRAASGSQDVYSIVLPTFIASVISAAAAVFMCRLLAKLK
ncbi:MAG: nucleoside recognition protein [Clostridia bacterium]|nr:nucleoside recognition protein [Clostridia bacterium]MBQ6703679.1 nucleoside recognition protein [Clostridia bacterium]